jgi:phosphate transport system substrate-binding protein
MKQIPIFIISCLVAAAAGCGKQSDKKEALPDIILASDPYLQPVEREVQEYKSLYPQTNMKVQNTSTRDAIVQLLNDSVHCVIVDRAFNDEERLVVKQLPFKITESRIASDGIAVIVNKQNPVRSLSIGSVRQLITGEAVYWDMIGELKRHSLVELVLTGRNSGMFELLMKDSSLWFPTPKPSVLAGDQAEAVRYVSGHIDAVSFISASLAVKNKDVKIVPVRTAGTGDGEKEYYPGQQEIYSSLYPFRYSLYLYNSGAKDNFGLGFSAFVLSNYGQKIIQQADLVPVSIPYRTIQINAE